jgi:DNA-3-methyladenine glycosylase I
MNDAGIIRNRLKINAAIENAKAISQLQKEHGSFEKWLQLNHPKTKDEWVKLFKKTFRFTWWRNSE